MGAAWPGSRGLGTADEGVRAHPGTCPTMRGHLAYPSLAILICAMGMVSSRGGRAYRGERAELVEGAEMDGDDREKPG